MTRSALNARNAELELEEQVYGDERFAGFDLYEFSLMAKATPDGTSLDSYKGRMEMIRAKAAELGLVEAAWARPRPPPRRSPARRCLESRW